MLENNKILALTNLELFSKIVSYQKQNDTNSVELIECVNGKYTAKVTTVDQKSILLHSKYNIEKDIVGNIETVDYTASLIICLGFGMGYEVERIFYNRSYGTKILVIEPRLDILSKAVQVNDYSTMFASNDFYMIGGDWESLKIQINNIADLKPSLLTTISNIYVHEHRNLFRIYDQNIFVQSIKMFKEAMHNWMLRVGNSAEDTLLGINHIFSNFPYILRSPDLTKITEYQNYPAICVASGPSLDKNIDVLKKYQNKALIFCVDSALEKLLKHGIIPDVVTVSERTKGLYDLFFAGKSKDWDEKMCLLGQSVIYPKIISEFPGPKIICSRSSMAFERNIGQIIPGMNNFFTGISVAHIGFSIAIELGCSPIILMGQDLAYGEEGFTHAKGTYGENRTEKDEKFKTVMVKSIDQKRLVKSTEMWDYFRRIFESIVRRNPNRVYINATEGGAYIEGMHVMPMQEVANQYLINKKDKVWFSEVVKKLELSDETIEKQRKEILEHFESELECLNAVREELLKVNRIFLRIDKMNKKGILEQNFFIAGELLKEATNKLGQALNKSSSFTTIIQALVVRGMQVINANKQINDVHDLTKMYQYVWNKVKEIRYILKLTIKEYKRGIKIIKTDQVDSIDTPLLGEMWMGKEHVNG
jgi:hypothetical protein